MATTLAIRLDYGIALVDHPDAAHRIGEIIARSCFAVLQRTSVRKLDRWSQYEQTSAEIVTKYLLDRSNDSVSFDNGRKGELVATADIQCGQRVRPKGPSITRWFCYIAMPLDLPQLEAVLRGVFDLAAAVQAAVGFVAAEPDYGLAQRLAVGTFKPKPRRGLSDRRRRERRARDRKDDHIDTQLAGVEWGTFLGRGHLERVNIPALRDSGVFERVIEISPTLAFLQLTKDPDDDLTDGFELKLQAARDLLAPVLMDISDVSVES